MWTLNYRNDLLVGIISFYMPDTGQANPVEPVFQELMYRLAEHT